MRAIQIVKPRKIALLDDAPKPEPLEGEVLVKCSHVALCGSNMGLHDPRQAASLIHICDNYGIDAISAAVTVAYILDYNERHPEKPLLNGATFGEFEKIRELMLQAGQGKLPEITQGVKRLANGTGETGYAVHVKGLELPAYLPATNPGYAWAIAGGHMSMQTYLLLLYERETGVDYWVDAITRRGLAIMRDDLVGICKFSGMPSKRIAEAIGALTGLEITGKELRP